MSSPPPEKKRSMITFDSLAQELIVSIIARVPREYYPTLSLVSKRFRALLVSPELYKARSLSNHTETCLYVCIEDDPDYHWFTLSRKPDQTLISDDDDDDDEEKKSSGYLLSRVPIPNSPPGDFWNLVTVGSEIYNIAGTRYEAPPALSSVSILDCRTNTWSKAPNLGVELTSVSVSAHDGMIYVVGRYEEEEEPLNSTGQALFKAFFKVLDTKTQTWLTLPADYSEDNKGIFSSGSSVFVDGKLHVMPWISGGLAAYNFKEARWEKVDRVMGAFMCRNAYCEIDNVLYSAFLGFLRWYDTQAAIWRNVMGLPRRFFNYACSQIRLVNFRGKIAAFWARNFPSDDDDDGDDFDDKKMIWFVVIAIDKRTSCEIWGIVESFDHVLTVPRESNLVKALAPTL